MNIIYIELNFIYSTLTLNIHNVRAALMQRILQFKMKHSNQEAVLLKSKYAQNYVERKCMKL